MSWAERSTGISPTITNSCPRTCSAGLTASTPISPDIDEQIEAHLAPFSWKTILGVIVKVCGSGVLRRPRFDGLGVCRRRFGCDAGGAFRQFAFVEDGARSEKGEKFGCVDF